MLEKFAKLFRRKSVPAATTEIVPVEPSPPPPPPKTVLLTPEEMAPLYAVLDKAKDAGLELSALLLDAELKKGRLLRTILDSEKDFETAVDELRLRKGLPAEVDYTLNMPESRDAPANFHRDPVVAPGKQKPRAK